MRRVISDFSVLISVVVWVLVNFFAQVEGVPTLTVPNILEQGGLYNENSVRTSFLINPLGNGLPSWAPIAAIIPALLATILLFMDQQITALVVNRRDNKLKVCSIAPHPSCGFTIFCTCCESLFCVSGN